VVLPAAASLAAESDAQCLARVDLAALKRRLGARRLSVLRGLDALSDESSSAMEAGSGIARAKAAEPHSAG
jgi:hypothetical protein